MTRETPAQAEERRRRDRERKRERYQSDPDFRELIKARNRAWYWDNLEYARKRGRNNQRAMREAARKWEEHQQREGTK